MKTLVSVLIALVALVGIGSALNPQPEPPMPASLADLGFVTLTDTSVTIDLGATANPEAAIKNVIGQLETMATNGQLDIQKAYIVSAGGMAMTLNIEQTSAERVKKTDHTGTYHFKSVDGRTFHNGNYHFLTSGPYSQSTSNIEDNGREAEVVAMTAPQTSGPYSQSLSNIEDN